jgi:hypothetical protein
MREVVAIALVLGLAAAPAAGQTLQTEVDCGNRIAVEFEARAKRQRPVHEATPGDPRVQRVVVWVGPGGRYTAIAYLANSFACVVDKGANWR